MFKACFFALSLLIVVGVELGAQRQEHVLDLVGLPVESGMVLAPELGNVASNERLRMASNVIVSHETGRRSSPFALTVTRLTMDRPAYAQGDPYEWEATLVNNGAAVVRFPTSADQSLFRAKMSQPVVASLGLSDRRNPAWTIGLVTLYGAPEIEGSIIDVGPGESLRIRAPGEWMASSAEQLDLSLLMRVSYDNTRYPDMRSDVPLRIQGLGRK